MSSITDTQTDRQTETETERCTYISFGFKRVSINAFGITEVHVVI